MTRRRAVIACGALAFDVRAIAQRRGWEIDVVPVPALLHNRPEQIPAAIAELRRDHDVVAVAYGDCGTYGALDDLPRLDGDSCYDIFAREEVAQALAEQPGTYFLTDFLARTFEHTVVRELGLDRWPELRDTYFAHYTRVLWLAQRPTPATRRCASAPPTAWRCRWRSAGRQRRAGARPGAPARRGLSVAPYRSFDPRRVGSLETNAWLSYYRRDWLALLRAAVGLTRDTFALPWPQTLYGAWLVLRANQQWAPAANDPAAARQTMQRFYGLLRRRYAAALDPAGPPAWRWSGGGFIATISRARRAPTRRPWSMRSPPSTPMSTRLPPTRSGPPPSNGRGRWVSAIAGSPRVVRRTAR